jgi:hypothetical protein
MGDGQLALCGGGGDNEHLYLNAVQTPTLPLTNPVAGWAGSSFRRYESLLLTRLAAIPTQYILIFFTM